MASELNRSLEISACFVGPAWLGLDWLACIDSWRLELER